jgi:ABC-2 type transport system permease protein
MEKYSQWRAMFAITRASFRSMLRNPSAVVFSILFPLIFILVFGLIGNGSISIDVGVLSKSDTTNSVYQALKHVNIVHFHYGNDSSMQNDLQKGQLDGLVYFQKNDSPGKPMIIKIKSSNIKQEESTIFKSVINNVIISQLQLMQKFAPQSMPSLPTIEEQQISARQFKTIDFILPGQLGFSLLSTGVFGVAFVFLSLREQLVIKRYFATPIRRGYIVVGEALSRLLFAMISAVVIVLIGHFAFNFTLINGFWTFLQMMALSAVGLIIFMGFGFIISGVAKNVNTVPPLANIVTLPQFLLSGTFFSISNFPSWLQPVCKILPLTSFNDAMRKVAFEGAGLSAISSDLLMLGIWGVVIYAVAFKVFKWE